jgi:bifunctional non-homologous end joining protein LigD
VPEACPFCDLPSATPGRFGEGVTAEEMSGYVWLRPEIAAEIKFTEWTRAGVLRHAEFVELKR